MMSDCGIPSEAEQEEAWEYVCKRELIRPETSIAKAFKYIMTFMCVDVIFTFTTFLIVRIFFIDNISIHPLMMALIVFFGSTILGLILTAKKAIVGLIKLYQHYAPERIRRKCIFKPTCSEYMIMAIEKFGLINGLYKGILRMFFKCRGHYYSIDYP
jgi:putative component of membrane protein insertase Oxa1/YidC/SpoIIIJ protein YidD